MDGSARPYNNDVEDKRYEVQIEFIKASNINQLFKKYNVPAEFDFLSIDIDGQDFHVWNALQGYAPRVVSIEMNYHMPPGMDKVMPLDDDWVWGGNEWSGASVTALKKLGNKKGYSLVATCMSDAIFVRNDLVHDGAGKHLFTNVDDEFELVRLNTDIVHENAKFNFPHDHFEVPLFSSSDRFLKNCP